MTMNRRQLILGFCSALGSSMIPGGAMASARPKRLIDGEHVPVIDIHAHCILPEVANLLTGTEFESVEFKAEHQLGQSRLSAMDDRGIDLQVLSVNRYWWYEADYELATRIVRLHDDTLAEWTRRHPDRFAALSSVALQFPELAAEQLEYAVRELGLRGASIAGHVLGEPLSHPRYDPFWATAESLGVPVLMHPHGAANVVRDGALAGNGDLGNIIGNPLETTVFVTKMIFDGALDRFPDLTVVAPHAGGYLPSYLGRTEVACNVRRNANCQNKRKPSDYLKNQIVLDTMIFSSEGLRHLVSEVGASQIVYGSDMPFNWPDTIDLVVNAPFLDSEQKKAILGGNLGRLLHLDTAGT